MAQNYAPCNQAPFFDRELMSNESLIKIKNVRIVIYKRTSFIILTTGERFLRDWFIFLMGFLILYFGCEVELTV